MATAGSIITAAFIKVGIDSPTTAQMASSLISLNNMISLLGADMLAPVVVSQTLALIAPGSAEYTIGETGSPSWNTVRPILVLSCFLRDSGNYDYPVEIMSSKDYALISNKSFDARPTELYFLPEYPLAKIIFNAIPPAGAYNAHFVFLKNFTEFALITTPVALPNEYKEALVYNLAVSLGEDWDRVVSKTVYMQAMRTREVIDRLNAATKVIPKAKFDFGGMVGTTDLGLQGGGAGGWGDMPVIYLGELDVDPNTTGWGASQAGTIWYNKGDAHWKGWNGTEIVLLG